MWSIFEQAVVELVEDSDFQTAAQRPDMPDIIDSVRGDFDAVQQCVPIFA